MYSLETISNAIQSTIASPVTTEGSYLGDTLNEVPTVIILFWMVLFIFVFALLIRYVVLRKNKPEKPPGKILTIMETFVVGFDNLIDGITGKRLKPAYPYFFSLLIFLLAGIFLTFFGFESPAISILFTFTLGTITFIGIYVVGITSKGLWHFIREKYANPLELFQQFSPLLSISIRLFGSTFGFTIILMVLPIIFDSFELDVLTTWWPLLSSPWSWVMGSVDIFLSLIQAYVFTLLTATYWSLELGSEEFEAKKEAKKAKKLAKKQSQEVNAKSPKH